MIDIEEREFRQLRKLGQKLHTPIPEAFLELEVRDQDGNIIYRHKQRSHSWVRNAYNHMFSELAGVNNSDDTFGAGKRSIKDTGGVLQYGDYPVALKYEDNVELVGTLQGYLAPAGNDIFGILVGSGENAESFEDYVLQTPIANGAGAGQLSYIASELPSVSYTDTTLKNGLVRYFNNNSGGSIAVNEVALAIACKCNGASTRYWIQARDKLGTTVDVPNTGQLKVTYTVQLTYPE